MNFKDNEPLKESGIMNVDKMDFQRHQEDAVDEIDIS